MSAPSNRRSNKAIRRCPAHDRRRADPSTGYPEERRSGKDRRVGRLERRRSIVERLRLIESEFGELTNRVVRSVRSLTRTLNNDPEAAQEVVQQACLKLIHRLNTPDSVSIENLEAWMRRVANNIATDIYRKRRPTIGGDAVESVPDRRYERERASNERIYRSEFIRRFIDSLPPIEKLAVILWAYRDFNREEIALLLKIKPYSVRKILENVNEKIAALIRQRGIGG